MEQFIEDNGGDRWVLDRLANGDRVGDIAADCIIKKHGPISRPFLYRWRDRTDDRRAGWKAAMQDAAHAHAEEAGEVWDKVAELEDPTTGQVAVARGRSEYKRWLAGRLNEEYRDGPQVQVAILAAGDLHLDALRLHGSMEPYRLGGGGKPALIPAEILEGDDDETES